MGFLIIVLILLLLRMLTILRQIKENFGKQLLVGVLALFAVQYLYNIGMIMGMLPLIGITLPFVSYGFLPAMFNAFLFGIVLSVCRRRYLVSTSK
ncbi:FtsW/RodA/SpoVE family cell cycle protein [Ectobacillus sp. JY-23]|uniref:FtsW/RodA/SpoVE family cell cycle protein n=1 Tax=Ectobacillus sp. JY-23 TaxID=2933872 RepID=UPI001FF48CA4|nr:FtsW/RodA/SpoVE family cell cycle protein [Ectobacillus sp. JY-23]UOY92005.1 FtsW/RodA/SpoVE family cell cycle protein [Ectobacillus sp. JY-23]